MRSNDIIEYIYKNISINEAIKNIVDKGWVDDFKSHFILQLMDIDKIKLIEMYDRNELIWFSLRIITNQWRSNTSSFWKIYRNGGNPSKTRTNAVEVNDDILESSEDEEELPDPKVIKIRIKVLLSQQYEDFLTNQYHKTLFELYYFDSLNLRQISESTEIHINTISRSIRKTKNYLKDIILNEI